jgi:hypothetical protein
MVKKKGKKESSKDKKNYSLILGILITLTLVLILFFLFGKITGNVISGRAVDTFNSFNPMVKMITGLIYNLVSGVYSLLEGPLEFIVGDTSGGEGFLQDSAGVFFAKVLLLILLLAIVYSILSNFGGSIFEKSSIRWVVSIIVAIFGVRFLTVDFIQSILLPYSVLGVVITSAIPFILYFYFVEKQLSPSPSMIRRIAWVLFGVVFLILWSMRAQDFSESEGIVSTIYPLTALIAFILAIMDGTIQHFFRTMKFQKSHSYVNARVDSLWRDKLNECENAFKEAIKLDPINAETYGKPRYCTKEKYKNLEGRKAYRADLDWIHDQIQENAS